MTYHQITSEERYILATLRTQGFNQSEIARQLGRHRSTICRELQRNSARLDGRYRPSKAIERTAGRRSRSRRNQRFSRTDLQRVDAQLVNGGARSRSPAGCAARSPLVMRRSIATSGAIVSSAARCTRTCAAPASTAQTLRRLRQPWSSRRQTSHQRTASRRRTALRDRSLGDRYRYRQGRSALPCHPRRPQNRLRRDR